MIVLLLRHGQTAYTREQRFLGRTDLPLDDVGRSQARAIAPDIGRFAPDRAIYSPLERTRETIALILGGETDVHGDDRLRELDFGAWEGMTPDEVAAADPEGKRRFDSGGLDGFPDGESPALAADRLATAIMERATGVDRLLVVGHNTAHRVALSALLGLDPKSYRRSFATLRPCHWALIRIEPDRAVQLIAYDTQEVIST